MKSTNFHSPRAATMKPPGRLAANPGHNQPGGRCRGNISILKLIIISLIPWPFWVDFVPFSRGFDQILGGWGPFWQEMGGGWLCDQHKFTLFEALK